MTDGLWNVGIIGCGRIAGGFDRLGNEGPVVTHAQAFHRHPAFKITAAVDPDPSALERFKNTWDVKNVFSDIRQLPSGSALDVVCICSPDGLHFSQAEHFLTTEPLPRFLMIEKPVCLAADELRTLTDLAQSSGVGVAVNHTRRFDSAHAKVAAVIQSGVLGSFVKGRCTYYGGWMHNGGHLLDTLIMFFGQAPKVETAVVSGRRRHGDEDLDVCVTIDGGPIEIDAVDEGDYQLFEVELRFQRGRVRLLDFGNKVTVEEVTTNGLKEQVLVPATGYPATGLSNPTQRATEAIDAYLRGKTMAMEELGVSLTDAAAAMQVLWEARTMALGEDTPVMEAAR